MLENLDVKKGKVQKLLKNKKKIFALSVIIVLISIPVLLLVDNEYAKLNTPLSSSSTLDNTLNLATFNIHEFWNAQDQLVNLNLLIDLIQSEEIDIIGFQEMWIDNVSYLANELQMYHFINPQTQQNIFHGLALLSKFHILESNSTIFNNSPINGVRGVIWAKISYNSQNISVYVTHLDTPATYFSQLNQVKQLLNVIDSNTNSIVFCDCNAPDTIFLEAYRIMTENFEDGWIASGKNTFEGRSWPSNSPFLRVDYIWLSKNDWIVNKGSGKNIGDISYSDHLGVKISVSKN